ncbi:hypothetical protein [Demequina activiva]|uniref:Uncharacterized protein n=1 Tax=Demequina activiva TaxID=1582364 RepID=A0A919Q5I1_9MICO|nr:hypothetical protein [Demequina activiva]GIG55547.1 hypothetical protein Dac01nite_22990 [Demequina activiva]
MRNAAIIVASLSLAACSAPAADGSVEPAPVETTEGAPAAPTQSAAPTFWELAPLGEGEHLKVHIDDRARAGDCEELEVQFERWVEADLIEGFTHEVLAYIEAQTRGAGCAT